MTMAKTVIDDNENNKDHEDDEIHDYNEDTSENLSSTSSI
jgi:hypothetical protein